jgi:DUF2971 family protein
LKCSTDSNLQRRLRLVQKTNMKIHDREYFYKYVSADTLINILKFQTMRWSSPVLFNDPFDLQGDPFDFPQNELLEAMIKNQRIVIKSPDIEFLGEVDPTMLRFRNAWQKGELGDEDIEELESKYRKTMAGYKFNLTDDQRLGLNKFITTSRVFCVAEENNNLLMWAHYSDSHKGVVIKIKCIPELDNPLCAATPVLYQKELPWIGAIDEMAKHFWKIGEKPDLVRWAYTKSDHWSYENEWRCIKDSRNLGRLYEDILFNPLEIEEIYLGCKMEKNHMDVIRHNLLPPKYSHIKVFQAKTNNREFKLDFDEVDLTSPRLGL